MVRFRAVFKRLRARIHLWFGLWVGLELCCITFQRICESVFRSS